MISVWTRETEGGYVSRIALGNHLRQHVGVVSRAGRRPVSDDLLEAVRDRAHERLAAGEVEPSLRDGIKAVEVIERNKARNVDRDIMLKITMALTGQLPPGVVRVIDPEVEILEAEYRVLLEGGDATEARAAADKTRQRLGVPALTAGETAGAGE
jgi:hypothetical protein